LALHLTQYPSGIWTPQNTLSRCVVRIPYGRG